MNCQIATRVSQFILAKIEVELCKEQQRWRDEGELDKLPLEQQLLLKQWETDRTEAAQAQLLGMCEQWTSEGLSADAVEARAEAWWADQVPGLTPWWTNGVFIDDFFGGCFAFFLPTMVRIFNEVFARYNVETADGRLDAFTGKPTKNKFEMSFTSMEILGLVVHVNIPGGLRCLTPERAEAYAGAAKDMVGRRVVPRLEFHSLLGRIVFASQALYKLRGVIPALLGVMQQHWASKDVISLSKEAWAALAWAAAILVENDGMVLFPERGPPGVDDRRVTWIFTDAARNPDAPKTQFTGYGFWIWPEGSTNVYVGNGQWRTGEQEMDSTSLEFFTANMALEMGEWLQELLWPGVGDPHGDFIMVNDNKSATDVTSFVRAKSPPLRVLLGQRAARRAEFPGQRIMPVHAFRELSEEADDLSKGEWEEMKRKINIRFGRQMGIVVMPPVPAHLRSSAAALAAHRRAAS